MPDVKVQQLTDDVRLSAADARTLLRLGEPPDMEPDPRGVTDLVLAAVARWGTPRRAEVARYLREQLEVSGFPESARTAGEALDALVLIGEVQACRIGGQEHLLATLPRLVTCGSRGFVLGVRDVTIQVLPGETSTTPQAYVRWLSATEADFESLAVDHDLALWDLSAWLGEPGWTRLGRSRGADQCSSAADLWRHFQAQVQQAGALVGDRDSIRVIATNPGDYFGTVGRGDVSAAQGRWQMGSEAGPGTFLGARRGHSDVHWLPCLVHLDEANAARVMDLVDWDELATLLLARGEASGPREVIKLSADGGLQQTCELPTWTRRALEVLATRRNGQAWKWDPLPGGEDALKSIITASGLRLSSV